MGGATKLYGAALYRLRVEDFGEIRHHDGVSPAWPITYDELEPYYTKAEQLYEVHGARGEDPTEPPASAPYPFPAVSHEPRIQQLHEDLAAAGLNPFHAPCGIRLNEANLPYSACVRCNNCDGFPCVVHGKSDAEVFGVRPALEHPNVTLLTNARAVKLETNGSAERGRGRGRRARRLVRDLPRGHRRARMRRGQHREAAADVGERRASQRPRQRLRPGGPQLHVPQLLRRARALARTRTRPIFQKTLGLNDFYFAGNGREYPLGNIQMVGKSQAPMFRGEKPGETKLAPSWTLEKVAKHAIDFWLSTEDLPLPENRVTVDGDGKVTLAYRSTNDVPKKELGEQLHSMLGRLGMEEDGLFHRFAYLKTEIPVAGVAHQAGTLRMGADAASSVVNPDCRAHEVDNLYIVDTSVFPSIGAVNPALTAMANSLRVGDHLLDRVGAGLAAAATA